MKIKEFIEKVNEHDGMWAKKTAAGIVIGTPRNNGIFIIPEDANNFLEIENWTVSNRAYWKKSDREYLSALIEEFLIHIPVKEERFPEKKWRLCIGKNSMGYKLYLQAECGPRELSVTINKDHLIDWADSDLVRLKEQYPRLAPAIEAMKEPVEE